jgi:hypothetical protein
VRAIVTALGFRTVFWTENTEDTSASPIDISTLFQARPGFISLQHDFLPGTTKYAIESLSKARAAGIATKPQPVAQCQGIAQDQWYKSDAKDIDVGVGGSDDIVGGNSTGKDSGAEGKFVSRLLVSACLSLFFVIV